MSNTGLDVDSVNLIWVYSCRYAVDTTVGGCREILTRRANPIVLVFDRFAFFGIYCSSFYLQESVIRWFVHRKIFLIIICVSGIFLLELYLISDKPSQNFLNNAF